VFSNLRCQEGMYEVLDVQLKQLLVHGAIRQVEQRPFLVSPIGLIPKPGQPGKWRLILDLRYLNQFLDEFPFSMETLQATRFVLERGDWCFVIDLTSAYHHVPVRVQDQGFLGFQWKGCYFVFCVLPFGMSTAPSAFTKVIVQVVKWWRKLLLRLNVYLDDFLFMERSKQRALVIKRIAVLTLTAAGFIISPKSQLDPAQCGKYLGLLVDSCLGEFRVPEKKWCGICRLVKQLARASHVSARQLTRLTGKLVALQLALGNVVRLFTKTMSKTSAEWGEEYGWSAKRPVLEHVRQELIFWRDSLYKWPPKSIWPCY